MNYEVVAAPIPRNSEEVEGFEAWLERAASAGGELVATSPSAVSGMMLCIFRVQKKGSLAQLRTL
jgi:hypothetical protein